MTAAKRLLDLLAAIVLAPLAIPLILLAAIAIRIESPGPAIFVQDRLGRHQKVFRCLKLRTMRAGTPEAATHEIGPASVTRVGRVLRASKLDELPQLWNVLTGAMSFVGPRPGLPVQTELTRCRAAAGVFDAVPGITGLAQVQGIDMSDPERLAQVERIYIQSRSVPLDILLMLKTATGAGRGDPARRNAREPGLR